MTQKILTYRLADTPIYEKPAREDYHPATALWLRDGLGQRLTTAGSIELEQYMFRQRFRLQ